MSKIIIALAYLGWISSAVWFVMYHITQRELDRSLRQWQEDNNRGRAWLRQQNQHWRRFVVFLRNQSKPGDN